MNNKEAGEKFPGLFALQFRMKHKVHRRPSSRDYELFIPGRLSVPPNQADLYVNSPVPSG